MKIALKKSLFRIEHRSFKILLVFKSYSILIVKKKIYKKYIILSAFFPCSILILMMCVDEDVSELLLGLLVLMWWLNYARYLGAFLHLRNFLPLLSSEARFQPKLLKSGLMYCLLIQWSFKMKFWSRSN